MNTPLSLECAAYKFTGTKPYRQLPHFFSYNLEELVELHTAAPEEAFFSLFGKWMEDFELDNSSLIEMVQYEDGLSHIFFLKRHEYKVKISPPLELRKEEIDGFSISLICTDNEPYMSLLREAIEHYQGLDMWNLDLNVTFFGNIDEAEFPGVSVFKYPRADFNMAYARNQGLKNCWGDHVFMLDVDVRLSQRDINSILNKYRTIPNHGVFNLKNSPKVGNGLYFGNKEVLIKNGYNENFKQCWFEDTEYLMNFSRTGVIPVVVFEPFKRIDHSRDGTMPTHELNFNLFSNILHLGKRTP